MDCKKLLISLLLIPALAFGADEPSQYFLDTLALAEQGDANAQSNLGVIALTEHAVKRNPNTWRSWSV